MLLVDNRAERAEAVRNGLLADGCEVVEVVADHADLVNRVRAALADVIVCAIDHPSRDALESMDALNRDEPRPVVMFVDRTDAESLARAIEAGVAAYVVEGLAPNRVKAVIDVAIVRFRAHQSLRSELAQARLALEDRKTIERAKGMLMERLGVSEHESYRTLQRRAMSRGRKLVDVARDALSGRLPAD